ncbi:MAG: DNA gyrase subunit A [Ruminococcaceae bacterium]|nr:DNA gyrase subunit A [Oscillospiraceae bacterium]
MEHKSENIEFPNQRIEDVDMEKRVKQAFIEYSMSVIMSRALPDVRDGMKPGQRRIMYAMYEDHLTADKPFRKSATTVGNVLGRYHPHGDAAVYGTMVRMAQDFSLRYPLVEGHGNFGSVDGDGAAAYRYTEARLAKISDEMMADLEKEVVPFGPNFDNRLREPLVLPSRFPNLLVNGSVGIAVGMATNIPPHNLGEVVDATVYRMDNPDCTVEELMEYVKGPDFPTAATCYGVNGIIEAYKTGRGRVMVRSKCEINEEKNQIIVTELPYQVNKSMLVQSIAALVRDKKIEGITDIKDVSNGRNGINIIIHYRRDANGQVLLNQLYKNTQLQDTCAINMLALVGGEPKVLSLPQILDHYIEHQKSVITRRTQFELDKAAARAHILEGYKIANDNIDEIVSLIRSTASIPDAKEKLMTGYGLTDTQAQAIVEMTLGKLTGLERQKIEDELDKLHALIAELTGILADEEKIKEIIKTEMLEIRRKYADERRTEIVAATDEIDLEDLIERHDCVITLTHAGYIKRQPADTYAAQHKGGKGIIGMTTKDEDFIEKLMVVHSHSYLMLFTNTGKVFMRKAYQIPEASRTAKGTNVINLIETVPGEIITAMISVEGFGEEEYLTMVTKYGVIKRTLLSEYEYQRKGGKIALNLDEGDELVFVMLSRGDKDVLLATHEGSAARFSESQVRPLGRTARGVRGVKLREGDFVVGAVIVDDSKQLITVTEKGFGKRTPFEDFRVKGRGGLGVTCHNLTDKTGLLAGIAAVTDDDDLMMITNLGTIIRTPVQQINTYSRTAAGVIVMRLGEGQLVSGFSKVAHEEQSEDTEAEVTPAEGEEPLSATGVTGLAETAQAPAEGNENE